MADIIEEIGDLIEDSDDKGEIRTVSQNYDAVGADSKGEVVVTVSDLVSVEEVVAVLVDPEDDGYEQVYEGVSSDNGIVAAEGAVAEDADIDEDDGTAEDNQVTVTFYTPDGKDAVSAVGSGTVDPFKVIARGY